MSRIKRVKTPAAEMNPVPHPVGEPPRFTVRTFSPEKKSFKQLDHLCLTGFHPFLTASCQEVKYKVREVIPVGV